jgi:hypothetical protein
LSLADDRASSAAATAFLNQWAYSVQTAFARNLPFFYYQADGRAADVKAPTLMTRDILTSTATGTIAPSIMDYAYNVEYSQTWSGGLQYQLRPRRWRRCSTWGRGRSAPTTGRCATCRSPARRDPGARADSAVEPRSTRSASTASRSTTR